MNVLEIIRIALSAIWANKMRSFLTMLGIIIGISSVMTITTLGQAARMDIQNEFSSYGLNRADVLLNWDSQNPPLYRDYITFEDLDALQGMKGQIEALSPRLARYVTAKYGNRSVRLLLNGVNQDYSEIEKIELVKGRFINTQDDRGKRNVVVLDEKTARELFGTLDCLGSTFTVSTWGQSIELMVVGITKLTDSAIAQMFESTNNSRGFSPISVVRRLHYNDRLDRFSVRVAEQFKVPTVGSIIINFLERRHRTQDKYRLLDYNNEMKQVTTVFSTVTAIVGGIAAISLIVGGIGVMNIMLVSVTERTREIGIRKALGAKRRIILLQFLWESVVISLIGGIIGIIAGCGTGFIVVKTLGLPFSISVGAACLSFLVTAGIGILFGVYPANKAAKFDPVEALRYE